MKKVLISLKLWALKYFWNIFSVIGVIATFYYSVFYVPDYVQKIIQGKGDIINESLLNDVQELIFNHQDIRISDIETLVKGKELKHGVKYEYSIDELLIQTQEKFMSNKFIPIEDRKAIFEKIDSIRANYTPPEKVQDIVINWAEILPWILSFLGIVFSIIGIISISRKFRKDQEIETDLDADEPLLTEDYEFKTSFKFEILVKNILDELEKVEVTKIGRVESPIDSADVPDFIINAPKGQFLIECKKYKKLIGLGTMRQFLFMVQSHEKKGILITTSGFTVRSKDTAANHNNLSPHLPVFLIKASSKEELKSSLKKILL
ncbi:MAG: hypothetical protein CV087_20870 [Candidatus Brocadia sp. WS118]|nr:MAG: hypothetical protein CV087_20870 [Candidatus Brocadia sp. WS118]